jgi:hypothetical protein
VNPFHTFHSDGRSGFGAADSPAAFEPLESRRLFTDFLGRVDFDVLDGDVGARGNGLGLPPPVLALPGPALDLPHPRDVQAGGRRGARASFDLRGVYTGTADIDGLGGGQVTLEVTRQRRGRVSGTLSSPLLDQSISGTVPVSFHGHRRFSIVFSQEGASVQVAGRANRDGTVTGVIEGSFEGQEFRGTFSLERIGGPGSRVGRID